MENAGYLWAAFGIIWALVFSYVLLLIRRQRRLREAIRSLRRELEENGAE